MKTTPKITDAQVYPNINAAIKAADKLKASDRKMKKATIDRLSNYSDSPGFIIQVKFGTYVADDGLQESVEDARFNAIFEKTDHLALNNDLLESHFRRVLVEHLPEDITVRTDLDGDDLLITDAEDVLFLEGKNTAIDTFRKMYYDILSMSEQTGRPCNCEWLDGYEGSFKEAYDQLTVEFKRMSDSSFADWPVARLGNERGVAAADPGAEYTNR